MNFILNQQTIVYNCMKCSCEIAKKRGEFFLENDDDHIYLKYDENVTFSECLSNVSPKFN